MSEGGRVRVAARFYQGEKDEHIESQDITHEACAWHICAVGERFDGGWGTGAGKGSGRGENPAEHDRLRQWSF